MRKMFILLALLSVVFIVGCGSSTSEISCSEDFECVPNNCCHADGTVNRDFAPDCSGSLCTMDCVEGSIDCGQGDLKCLEGQCQVVWKE